MSRTVSWWRSFTLAAVMLGVAACGGSNEGGTDGAGQGSGQASEQEDVEVRLVTPLVRDTLEFDGFWIFIEELEREAPWIKVNYIGGPEVSPSFDQIEALANGSFDMAPLVPGYMGGFIPGAPAMLLSPNDTPADDREAGTYEVYNELFFEPKGVKYLGDTQAHVGFAIWLGDSGSEINLEDAANLFDGMTIRGGTQYSAVVEPRGGAMVNMPPAEVYTALERGVIDGYGAASVGIFEQGWGDVTKYQIKPTFKSNKIGVGINQAWWESLNEETRAAMEDALVASEPLIDEHYLERIAEAEQEFLDAGIEVLELEGADAEAWADDALEGGWKEIAEFDPAAFSRLQETWYGEVRYGQ